MNRDACTFLPVELLIGVPRIDLQHAGLFRKLAMIKEICLRDSVLPGAEAEALQRSLSDHYATEEEVAREIGIDFSVHAEKHRNMLQLIGRALDEVLAGKADVFGTLRYIEYWFERHIAQDDMCLGEQARSQPVQLIPASLSGQALR